MILTCPRCATRYLVDEAQVWTTGRTVQCEACEETWVAFGVGIRQQPLERPSPDPPEPPPTGDADAAASDNEHTAAPALSPIAPAFDAAPAAPQAAASPGSEWLFAAPSSAPESAPTAPAAVVAPPATSAPVESPPPSPPPGVADEPLVAPALFRTPSARRSPPRNDRSLILAISLIVLVVVGLVAGAIVYRDVIVGRYPALAGVYAAIGLRDASPAKPPAARGARPHG